MVHSISLALLTIFQMVSVASAGHCYAIGSCGACTSDDRGAPCAWCNGGCQMASDSCSGNKIGPGEQCPGGQQNKQCTMSAINITNPDILAVWGKCLDSKYQTKNMQVAGSYLELEFECWCEHKIEDTLSEFGCCYHQDFAMFCHAQCEPQCSVPAAQKCIQDCPAKCFEGDYAPEFCGKGCTGCTPYLRCITRHSHNMTTSGNQSLLCDDAGFDNSTQWHDWLKCYAEQPSRTHWFRHNAENYCLCQADVKGAATQHKCCDASWGKTLCDDQCETAEMLIDCNSAEALKCGQDCQKTCTAIHTQEVVPACRSKCIDPAGECGKYSVCKPTGPMEFDYVCNDGAKPMNNGCCPVDETHVACPSMCESATPHVPIHVAFGIGIQHNLQCECLGCPSTTGEAKDKWKKELVDHLWANGVSTLAVISKEVGILGSNREMQELMKERNAELMKVLSNDYDDGALTDEQFRAKVDAIVKKYNDLIRAEAKRFKQNGEKEEELQPKMELDAKAQLTEPVEKRATTLPVAQNDGFALGRHIVIDEGTRQQETNQIVKFGSIILQNPLKWAHPAGVMITMPKVDAISFFKRDVRANVMHLPLDQTTGFKPGRKIIIGQGTRLQEVHWITNLTDATLTLRSQISFEHSWGTFVNMPMEEMKAPTRGEGSGGGVVNNVTRFIDVKVYKNTTELTNEQKKEVRSAVLVLSIMGALFLFCVCGVCACCVWLHCGNGCDFLYETGVYAPKKEGEQQQSDFSNPMPIDGDSNVVVGRPISADANEASAGLDALEGLEAGAPVATGGKKGQEEEGDIPMPHKFGL